VFSATLYEGVLLLSSHRFILGLVWVLAGCGASSPSAVANSAELKGHFAPHRDYRVGALIYHGVATAFGDVESIGGILDHLGISYQDVTSEELNRMSLEDLSQFGMIVWPGGYAGQMSRSLEPSTRDRIRRAVQERGVSFVGICAGAFIAVSPAAPKGAEGPDWGLSIISTETLPYYHLEDEGVDYSLVDLDLPQGDKLGVVWWGGPTLPEVSHGVIARYGDNHQPAVIQTQAGLGFVILSGPHPEAPASWRSKLGLAESDGLDHELAARLFKSAFERKEMSTL